MSWGNKRHHHLKLTQLFSCKSQSTPPPIPPNNVYEVWLLTSNQNLTKTINCESATANQDQCNNTQGETYKNGNGRGAFPPPTKKKGRNWKKKLSSTRKIVKYTVAQRVIILNYFIRLSVCTFHDSRVMRWHKWVTFVCNNLEYATITSEEQHSDVMPVFTL